MATISNIQNKNNQWIPKEAPTAALGISIATISTLALHYFLSSVSNFDRFPSIAKNFVLYGCGAAVIAGAVMGVYSTIRLCQKITEKNELHKAVTATALGILFTALVEATGRHIYKLAPSFDRLMGHSMAYAFGTNLAMHACLFAGGAAIVFTAYAAYSTGRALLATVNPTN
jgi:hypothetical protein